MLPVLFLFSLAFFTAAIVGFGLLVFSVASPHLSAVPGVVGIRARELLPTAVILGYIVSWSLAWSYVRRKQLPAFLHGFVLVLVGTAALAFSGYAAAQLGKLDAVDVVPVSSAGTGHGIQPGVLHSVGNGVFYATTADPLLLNGLYVRRFDYNEFGQHIPEAVYDNVRGEVVLPGTGASYIPPLPETQADRYGVIRAVRELQNEISVIKITEFNSTVRSAIQANPLLALAGSSIDGLGTFLVEFGDTLSVRLFVMAAGFSLFLAGCWLFQKGAVWPFVSSFAGILIGIAGAIFLKFLLGPEVTDLATDFVQDRTLAYIGPVLMAVLGVLFAVFALAGSRSAAARTKAADERRRKAADE